MSAYVRETMVKLAACVVHGNVARVTYSSFAWYFANTRLRPRLGGSRLGTSGLPTPDRRSNTTAVGQCAPQAPSR